MTWILGNLCRKEARISGLAALLEHTPEGVTLHKDNFFPPVSYISGLLPYYVQYRHFFIGVADRFGFKRHDTDFPDHIRPGVEKALADIQKFYEQE